MATKTIRRVLVILVEEIEQPAEGGHPGRENSGIRRCTKCGAVVRWSDLRPIGIQRIPGGRDIELANCACGTTLGREIPDAIDTEGHPSRVSEPTPSSRPRQLVRAA